MNTQSQRLLALLALLSFSLYTIAAECNDNVDSHYYKLLKLPKYGYLKGSISRTTWTNRPIYQFLGVRYAESPSGRRRFKAPVPVKPWNGIRDARSFGRKCPTLKDISVLTETERRSTDLEDCLNMAIYSPNLTGSFPVMVYVHGGSFYLNSADQHPPNYLLERNVVLVVPQYRLDALGFLSTNSDEIPGNAALWDVQQALTFVKENIASFGGNPKRVTLFGQSAGAAIVSALTISPAVPSNLFHRVIIQSGSIFSKWSVTTDPVKDAKDIAEAGGLNSKDSIELLNKAFMRMEVFDLLSAVDRYQKNLQTGPLKLGARSISIGGPNNLLPDLPEKIVSSDQYKKKSIPMMIGTTEDDGSYVLTVLYDFLAASMQATGSTNSPPVVPWLLELLCNFLSVTGDQCKGLQSVVSSTFWTNEEVASTDVTKIIPGLIDLLGTLLFKLPALQLATANKGKTFLYSFDYKGNKTRFGYEEDTSRYPFSGGVTHSDDNIYLFPYPVQVTNLNEADTEMARQMVELWTSFASNGRPRSMLRGVGNPFLWEPMVPGTLGPYVRINKELTVENDYPKEFVRNVSEKKVTDYRPLIALFMN